MPYDAASIKRGKDMDEDFEEEDFEEALVPRCASCGLPFVEHSGIVGTCAELKKWKRTSEQLWDVLKKIRHLAEWKDLFSQGTVLEQMDRLQGLDFYANGLERFASEVAPLGAGEIEHKDWKRTAEVLWNSLGRIEKLCGDYAFHPQVFLDRVTAEIMRIRWENLEDVKDLVEEEHPSGETLRLCTDEKLQQYLNKYVNPNLPDFKLCWTDLLELYGIAVVPQSRDGGFDWLATDLSRVRYSGDIVLEPKEGTEFSDPRVDRAVTCCAILSGVQTYRV